MDIPISGSEQGCPWATGMLVGQGPGQIRGSHSNLHKDFTSVSLMPARTQLFGAAGESRSETGTLCPLLQCTLLASPDRTQNDRLCLPRPATRGQGSLQPRGRQRPAAPSICQDVTERGRFAQTPGHSALLPNCIFYTNAEQAGAGLLRP